VVIVARSGRGGYTGAITTRRDAVLMFARLPEPGVVKTRLASALAPAATARLYRAFTEDLCARLGRRFRLVVACSPDDKRPYFGELARRYGCELIPQGGGDLGARMRRAAAAVLETATRAVLIGSDAPTVPAASIGAAFRALAHARVAIGPSLDGGYYLLGVRSPLPPIFSRMPWGTPAVLARTLRRLRRARITPALVPCWYDVDTPADLGLLRRHLALLDTLGDRPCPRTTRVLGAARLREARA
jgi:rSAM/selenodomain-associated transferase 1